MCSLFSPFYEEVFSVTNQRMKRSFKDKNKNAATHNITVSTGKNVLIKHTVIVIIIMTVLYF